MSIRILRTLLLALSPALLMAGGPSLPASGPLFLRVLPDLAACLPGPPLRGSLGEEADLEAVRQAQAWRSPAQVAWAKRVDRADIFDLMEPLGPAFTAANLPRLARLLEQVQRESSGATRDLKRRYDRPRPPRLDPALQPCVDLPGSASYPSGHTFSITLAAGVIAEVLPELKTVLQAQARRAAWGRVLGGVHYPTDLEGGRLLAEAFLAELRKSRDFLEAVAACREESAVRLLPAKAA